MKSAHLWKVMFVLPIAGLLAVMLGCPPAPSTSAPGGGGGGGEMTEKKEDVVVKGKKTVSIKGKVTYKGDAKLVDELQSTQNMLMETQSGNDKSHCLKGDTKEQKLVLGKDNGVANAFVWVRTPKGTHFVFDKDEVEKIVKDRKPPTVDQPFCAFQPHAQTMFPGYWDPSAKPKGKLVDTGEKLLVKNSAPIAHNTKWGHGSTSEGSQTINPNSSQTINVEAKDTEPLDLACDYHKYMKAYVWAFEHPFAAVTDADGNYEIKNVPAGTELQIVAWHELADGKEAGFLGKVKSPTGEKIKVEEGKDITKDFEVK